MARLLLTGDWHVREDTPVCRTDDFYSEVVRKVRFVVETANARADVVLHSGDLFDRGRPVQSQMLEVMLLEELGKLKVPFLIVPGNHDMPYHNETELERSSFGVLQKVGVIKNVSGEIVELGSAQVSGFGYGRKIESPRKYDGCQVCLWHGLVLGEDEIPGGARADDLLRKLDYDLVVTGDNHQQIVAQKGGRTLVNPGSLLRMSVDQVDHEPAVFLYDTLSRVLDRVVVPIAAGVISREHKEVVEERDRKVLAFVESMKGKYEVSLSFERNLEVHMVENQTSEAVRKLVWDVVG